MPSEEWKKLQEALGKAPTEEARKEAAEALRRHQEASGKKSSKPTLVSLGYNKDYPSAIPLDQVANEIERNPVFFEHIKKIVVKEK